jgi:uncharacterized protein YegP (UPF0339 family)
MFRRLLPLLLLALWFGAVSLSDAPAQDKKDKKDAGGAVTFEVYKDKSGEYRFRLKSGDTMLAISGKGYEKKADIEKVIGTIQKEAGKAKVVEAEDKK